MSDSYNPTSNPVHNPARQFAYGNWLAVLLISFTLYALTANRGIQWQDSGKHILRIATGQLENNLGLALCHPLHYWLGRLAVAPDLFEPCFAVTLVSSLAAAMAAAVPTAWPIVAHVAITRVELIAACDALMSRPAQSRFATFLEYSDR